MRPTARLNAVGQSLWLDTITRSLLDSGELGRIIAGLDVTGLTSNPTIFDKAVSGSAEYDAEIRVLAAKGLDRERIFFRLAIADLVRAADLFREVHRRSAGVDGWVSLEVSPELAYDPEATARAAAALHAQAGRKNLFIKIPGTAEGLPAVTASIAAGVPVNVTLLFDADQYRAAADAYLTGIEQRVARGLDPDVGSVASVFMSRWDKAVADRIPDTLRDKLALAVGGDVYRAYREVLDSDRMQRLATEGARPQRLLWASTSTKDPHAPDTLYVGGLAAPNTINTMPDSTVLAFADHGEVGEPMAPDGGDCDAVLAEFAAEGIDVAALAAQLQTDGADAFVKSWKHLIERIESQRSSVA